MGIRNSEIWLFDDVSKIHMTKKQGTFLERNLRAHSCAKSLFLQFIERKKAQCVHFPNFLSRLCTIAPKLFLIGVFSGHYSFLLICTDPKVGFRGARMDIYQAHQTENSGNCIRANSTENDYDFRKNRAGPGWAALFPSTLWFQTPLVQVSFHKI